MDGPHRLGKPVAMRPLAALAAAAFLLGGGTAIIVMGGKLQSKVEPARVASPVAETVSDAPVENAQKYSSVEQMAANPQPSASARGVAPERMTPPTMESAGFERVEPRAALSDIGQALPPKPKMPDEWKGTTLFNPVATAAGLLEAKGYKIALAGIEPVMPEEQCDTGGRSWPCGVRARAAFRAWLRGRSIICGVPPQPDREAIVVPCKVGKQDVSAWLAASGWARAAANGPYAELGDAAAGAKKGIHGAPPATNAATTSTAGSDLPAPSADGTAILSAPLAEPLQDEPAVVPPQEGPLGDFPTPPAAPTAPAQ